MKEFAKGFYKSTAWKNARNNYAASVGGLCEECLKKGIYRAGEIVHHVIELTPQNITDESIALNANNLKLLCRDCHGKVHGHGRRYKTDELGRIIFRD